MLKDDGIVTWHEVIERLTRWVRPRVHDPADADELVQDILERLVMYGERLQTVENPLGWIHRVAANAIIDYYRRPRRNVVPPEDLPSEAEDAMASPREELAGCIRPLVMHLDPLSREALLATDLGGKSQVDAAREAGITLSTMKSRIQRGRQKLRAALLRCCHVELDRRNSVIEFSQKKAAGGGSGVCCDAVPSALPPGSPPAAAASHCALERKGAAMQWVHAPRGSFTAGSS
jgi:RNA polymerase sigma-70 factor (ECF subfamily)